MGADFYQASVERKSNLVENDIPVGIGIDTIIRVPSSIKMPASVMMSK
jgi:hypothetical protein